MQSAANPALGAATGSDARLRKVAQPTGAICALLTLSEPGQALLGPEMQPAEFIDLLCAEGLWADAIRFLAHALPKREAVWWACVAARAALADDAPARQVAVIEAAEAWVYQPTEENRRAAMEKAEAAG